MNIFEMIYDFFYYRLIDIEYFFKTRGKMYECMRSKHGTYIRNPHNIDAKKFNLKVDFNGQNENAANYVGHDYILLNEELNLVFFRDVIEHMHNKYGDNFKIRTITFQTQYNTKKRKNKFDNYIYFTSDEERDNAIIEKADSIFQEWVENKPKYMEFKQSDWEI